MSDFQLPIEGTPPAPPPAPAASALIAQYVDDQLAETRFEVKELNESVTAALRAITEIIVPRLDTLEKGLSEHYHAPPDPAPITGPELSGLAELDRPGDRVDHEYTQWVREEAIRLRLLKPRVTEND